MKRTLTLATVMLACSSPGHRGPPVDGGLVIDALPTCTDCSDDERFQLQVSPIGIALSSLPGRSVLTRTLQVHASQRRSGLAWSAASDQAWLSATPTGTTGTTGGTLTLTANPTGLAPERLYLAEVRVTSSDPRVHNDERVQVGLWVGSAAPADVTLTAYVPNLVTDPVAPYVYTNTGGTDITVYDIYRGGVVRTFSAVVGRAGTMAISSDGAILFVDDATTRDVVAIDTQSGRELRRYHWGAETSSGIAYARPDAHPILMIGAGAIFDVETGARYPDTILASAYHNDLSFAVDLTSEHAYAQNQGLSPSRFRQFALSYNELGAHPLSVRGSSEQSGGSNGGALCVSADGARVYTANGAPYVFPVFSTDGLMPLRELPGDAYPNNMVCGWNGLIYGGASSKIWVYRDDGTPVTTFILGSNPRTLVLSGDNTRILGSIDGTPLTFSFRSTPQP